MVVMKKIMILVFGVMLMVAYGCKSGDVQKAEETEQTTTEATTETEQEAAEDTEQPAH